MKGLIEVTLHVSQQKDGIKYVRFRGEMTSYVNGKGYITAYYAQGRWYSYDEDREVSLSVEPGSAKKLSD